MIPTIKELKAFKEKELEIVYKEILPLLKGLNVHQSLSILELAKDAVKQYSSLHLPNESELEQTLNLLKEYVNRENLL